MDLEVVTVGQKLRLVLWHDHLALARDVGEAFRQVDRVAEHVTGDRDRGPQRHRAMEGHRGVGHSEPLGYLEGGVDRVHQVVEHEEGLVADELDHPAAVGADHVDHLGLEELDHLGQHLGVEPLGHVGEPRYVHEPDGLVRVLGIGTDPASERREQVATPDVQHRLLEEFDQRTGGVTGERRGALPRSVEGQLRFECAQHVLDHTGLSLRDARERTAQQSRQAEHVLLAGVAVGQHDLERSGHRQVVHVERNDIVGNLDDPHRPPPLRGVGAVHVGLAEQLLAVEAQLGQADHLGEVRCPPHLRGG